MGLARLGVMMTDILAPDMVEATSTKKSMEKVEAMVGTVEVGGCQVTPTHVPGLKMTMVMSTWILVEVNPRFTPYGRGGSSSRGRFNRTRDRDGNTLQRLGLPISNETRWTKVTVPHGKKCEKDFLLKTINGQLSAPFEPVYFHHEGKNAVISM
ncbi:nuclear RNA export factor 1-like [Haliotis rubra]|uniref:nuclear RNA export factor 1-like n=1 Tax=Haliotis rubra TaxID=36100 RepID=UPI001EE5B91B|nr:nuclear RNA export factor 1-like [Haliotis rubra]